MLVIRFMFKGYVSSSILILRALPRHIHESKSGTALTIIYDASRVLAMRERAKGGCSGRLLLEDALSRKRAAKIRLGFSSQLSTIVYWFWLKEFSASQQVK